MIERRSLADGAKVADLHLPRRDLLLGAVVRPDGSSEIVRGPTELHAGDKVVVFARPIGDRRHPAGLRHVSGGS